MIEASLLFSRPASDVHVLIHPTSTVHALVEFVDGSILLILGQLTCRCRSPTRWRKLHLVLVRKWRGYPGCPAASPARSRRVGVL